MINNFLAGLANAIKARTAQSFSVFIPVYMEGQPVYSERKFRNYVNEGYKQNEIIYACIELTANTAAQTRLQVLSKGNDEPIEDHELRKLLERPNSWMTEFDFWVVTLVSMKLAGAAYWFKARAMGGQGPVTELWPLRPDLIAPIPGVDSDSVIAAWEYMPDGGVRTVLDANDVLAFRRTDPLDFYKVVSPVGVLAKSADVDTSITNYLKKFFDRGAMPAGALKSKLKLSPMAITDLMNSWEKRYGGAENWHKPVILDSDAEYQRTGLTFEEMDFSELDARNELRICMALGVPPILIGARAGLERSTFSNYEEARRAWWQDHLIPLYKFLSDTIDLQLAPEFGEDVDTEWDFSEVPALNESRDSMFTRANAGVTGGWFTVNMALREIGVEEIGEPGEIFLRGQAVTPIPINETVEDQRALAQEEAEAQQANALAQLEARKPPPKDGEKPGDSADDDAENPFDKQLRKIVVMLKASDVDPARLYAAIAKAADTPEDEPEGEDMPPLTDDEIDRLWALYARIAE